MLHTSPAVRTYRVQPSAGFDDLYEYYDPDAEPEARPRRELSTPASQRRPASASPGSHQSLRRTPRLRERNLWPRAAEPASSGAGEGHRPTLADRRDSTSPTTPFQADLLFDEAESATSQIFRRIVSDESLWPPTSTSVSRRSRDAILFALEAIRTGDGKNYKALSADLEEESARMSDYLPGDQPGVSNGSARPQNGGSRAARGVPVPAPGVRTPTEVMRLRRERDARKKAQEEESARLRNLEQEESGRQQEAQATLGLVEDTPVRRRPTRPMAGDIQDGGRRTSGGHFTSRRQESIAPAAAAGAARSRATTIDQRQPRAVVPQQARGSSRYEQQPMEEPSAGPSQTTRTNPTALANVEDPAQPRVPIQPIAQTQPQSASQTASGRTSFPNALERWETLSSHWEGLTSYWIRRLQENSNELNREPLSQQMSRQIIDLSAAGSNLFLAVFELQRLRASTDRKFQRWFFETRSELERYQGQQAELDRLLRVEREERARVVSSTGTAEAERLKAEELVKEMRRELQISKEEARRAWEELGRREQEERDRTVSLRSGEPTLVGGVQVVPMTQGVPGRQTTAAQTRPQTRDGPYPGGPSAGAMGGQNQAPASASHTTLESPDEEERQFTYQRTAASPTDTDPFTEEAARAATQPSTSRAPEASRPSRETPVFYQRPTQPITSSSAIASIRQSQAPTYPTIPMSGEVRGGYGSAHQATTATTNGSAEGRFYQQPATTAALQPSFTAGSAQPSTAVPARPGTRNTDLSSVGERSYIPSTASGNGSDDEYEIDAEGNFRRDEEGRRIPWREPTGPADGRRVTIASEDGSDDEYDVQSEIEREQEYARRYGAGARQPVPIQQQQPPTFTPGTTSAPSASNMLPPSVSRPTASSPQSLQPVAAPDPPNPSTVDYSGQGYGGGTWDSYTSRHRHPSQLSDITEQDDERSRRTSPNPSRTSWLSGAGQNEPAGGGGGGGGGGAVGGAGQQPPGGTAREMRERYGGGLSGR